MEEVVSRRGEVRGKVPGRCLGRVGCNGRLFVVKGFRVGSE